MRNYLDCDVRFDDDTPTTRFRQGRVTINGNNATIWRKGDRRFEQVDRLTNIAVTETHGDKTEDLVIVGESSFAVQRMKLAGKDAVVTARIHSRGGCPTC